MKILPTVAVAACLVSLLPSLAAAQRESAPVPGISAQWNSPPPPSPPPPTLPPPNHGGPSAHPGSGNAMPSDDLFLAGPRTYAPRFDRRTNRRDRSRRGSGYSGLALPPFGYSWAVPAADESAPQTVQAPEGRLLLRVAPRSAQILVDGFYVGVVDDFAERGLWLPEGSHRIELNAGGYESNTFDVRIVAGETISYRRELRPTPESPTRQASAPAKPFYVIPRCYAGDSVPRADQLPAGCSTSDLRTVPPRFERVQP